jgi:hypothetical protein
MNRGLATGLVIAFLDMLTTYINMNLYNTCELEKNPVLRYMCSKIGYSAAWLWLPVEASVIALWYEGIKRLREAFGVGTAIENLFLALTTIPIANNILIMVRAPQAAAQQQK